MTEMKTEEMEQMFLDAYHNNPEQLKEAMKAAGVYDSFRDLFEDEKTKRLEEIRSHIDRSHVPDRIRSNYDLVLNDIVAILSLKNRFDEVCTAYNYGFSRGWRAAKNAQKK